MRQALRAELEPQGQWPVRLRSDLAKALSNSYIVLENVSG
ncbi:hypothetical protein MES5069_480005 [Mesorhizobium escarrei]|uniref:Uncharacterized protein n=1 Tax=Mesorhizobium escarrei TaxID=666018 RepID=A0ABM9SFT4_9HYPH|nr:hypothetical protein MES5069_480005 [Mesorhizobium escarrei]